MQPRYLDFIVAPEPEPLVLTGIVEQMLGAYWPGRYPETRPLQFQFNSVKMRGLWNPGPKELIAVYRVGEKIIKIKHLPPWTFPTYSGKCDNILEFSPKLWRTSEYYHGGKWAFNIEGSRRLDGLDLI